ncbi:hypothetical protein [Alkalihalobacterium alkalinitrilicum]|uniref:hypothetical protein n=1 Tax=Alkalihalobacterium alkalinitrilicum TaxID=427920 RepID=UPI0009953D3E|nr:hypothetical protein [Alkalihalobacterium alkalinitrilicum]
MEKYIDVMKKSLELSETILEGLEHIQKLLSEGNYEQSILLMEDVLVAYTTIGRSIEPVKHEFDNETIGHLQNGLKKTIELVVNAYESKSCVKVHEIIQFSLLPQFKKFKHELEQNFHSYIVS